MSNSGDDGRIVRANFSLKLQGYIVPDNVQKKLKEQNTKYFSKAQIVLNQATTVIEEPSKRATTLRSIRGGTGGGGSVQNVTTTNNYQGASSNVWSIDDDNLLINNENRNISIESAYLQVDIGNEPEDIFLIKKNGNTKLKVNNDGVLVFTEFTEFPSTPEGGLIYMNDNFYFGI